MEASWLFLVIALLAAVNHAKNSAAIAEAEGGNGDQQVWVQADEGDDELQAAWWVMGEGEPNQHCTDAHVNALNQGGQALRTHVNSCAQAQAFHMPASARELFLRHIPVDFDKFNARPRGCVEIQMRVDEVRSGQTHRTWQVIVDVDNKTATQNAHYGYTVEGIRPKVSKTTGHIFFPPNVFPPNVRPWLGESKGQLVHFADHINGPSNTVFRLSGRMYNQFHTHRSEDDDDDKNEDVYGSHTSNDDDKGISLRTYII